MNRYQSTIETLISPAGIHLNGTDDFDIHVYDDRFYRHVLRFGSLGLGESYMNEWWDCKALDTFLYRLLTVNLEKDVKHHLQWQSFKAKIFNLQSITRAVEVAKRHYNIGNELFENMLDKYMIYSCAYWSKATTLEQAQEDKLDLICRKLKLSPGMEILDIGCGWGGFAQFAAERYQVKVTGVTISSEQAILAKERCKDLPVRILLEDYRLLKGNYDRIVSIGMFEHVGYKNYDAFMKIVKQCLRKEGVFLLHCIGNNESGIHTDPWIDRYIFPNGMMPSPTQISKAAEPYFVLQDWHNFGLDYDLTLMEWLKRFRASWSRIKHHYDDRFYRMWEYYLCISAASFRAHKNNLWQIIYTHPDYPERYSGAR